MAAFQRRHYLILADIVCRLRTVTQRQYAAQNLFDVPERDAALRVVNDVEALLIRRLQDDNYRFQAIRFSRACDASRVD